MTGLKQEMYSKLETAFAPGFLSVEDVSEQHRGHAGFQEGGESHFDLEIASEGLKGKSRVAQHRAIYAALGTDIMGRIHALAIKIRP